MRAILTSSVFLGLMACLALGVSVDACGGTAFTGAGDEGGIIRTDGGNPPEAGDGSPDGPVLPGDPLSLFGAYAVRTVFLGETNRSGAPTKDAWKEYGANLDGIVSVRAASNGECILQAGADSAKREDGIGGIDNSFGRTVLGFILGVVPTPTKTTNDAIAIGGRTMMLNLLPASGSTPARVGFLSAASTSTAPLWNGSDTRAAAASTVGSGPEDALSTATSPRMTGRLVASGIASGTFYLDVPLGGSTWRIPIHQARVTMTISDDGLRATNGTLAGIVPTEELITELEKAAGRISTQLCSGSTLDSIKQTVRQASDILVDGTQDPSKACSAVSIGIGFEAVKVSASGVAAELPPGPDPCK